MIENNETSSSHTIIINNQAYTFQCADGEEYVEKIRHRLTSTIEQISDNGNHQLLSKYSMKLALLLTEGAVREEIIRENDREKTEERMSRLIEKLDQVLDVNSQN